jgi:hypothetical protein
MLGSHWLAYLLAAPDSHARAHLLEVTGHGYWPVAAGLAIAALVASLFGFVGNRLRADGAISSSKTRIFAHALPRTLVLQVGGFFALEVIERVLVGHNVGLATLLESTFVIGIGIQVVAALLTALLLVGVAFAVERLIARRARPASPARVSLPLVSLIAASSLVPATGGLSLRGPPSLH